MSNWTHVVGAIRLDAIRDRHESMFEVRKEFEEYFGKTLDYYSDSDLHEEAYDHPERFLPMGSEGSLKMSIWINPRLDSVASYTVTIFGDLRDHDNAKDIVEWFKKKCDNDDIWVRDAVITAYNEVNGGCTWAYNENEMNT